MLVTLTAVSEVPGDYSVTFADGVARCYSSIVGGQK